MNQILQSLSINLNLVIIQFSVFIFMIVALTIAVILAIRWITSKHHSQSGPGKQ